MEFRNSIPIYLQVMEDMKREMVTGGLPAGSRVESVRALAARYGINLNTMQRVCAELERQGYEVTYLKPDKAGRISIGDLTAALRPESKGMHMRQFAACSDIIPQPPGKSIETTGENCRLGG